MMTPMLCAENILTHVKLTISGRSKLTPSTTNKVPPKRETIGTGLCLDPCRSTRRTPAGGVSSGVHPASQRLRAMKFNELVRLLEHRGFGLVEGEGLDPLLCENWSSTSHSCRFPRFKRSAEQDVSCGIAF
jgi:hypothetical protein